VTALDTIKFVKRSAACVAVPKLEMFLASFDYCRLLICCTFLCLTQRQSVCVCVVVNCCLEDVRITHWRVRTRILMFVVVPTVAPAHAHESVPN
jgi:hypothetical protein